MPEAPCLEWEQLRLGTFRPDQERPRPVRMQFNSMNDKHIFLKHAKHLKEVNLRYDDDLTRLQQRQRQDMAADFDTLKSKGHKPFYRGSSLKFRHADKTCTRKRHAMCTTLPASCAAPLLCTAYASSLAPSDTHS